MFVTQKVTSNQTLTKILDKNLAKFFLARVNFILSKKKYKKKKKKKPNNIKQNIEKYFLTH